MKDMAATSIGRSSCRCRTRPPRRGVAGGSDRLDRRAGADRNREPVRPGDAIEDRTYQIAQANNALVFPGLGLGVVVVKATRISDRMIAAAADAVAQLSDADHAEVHPCCRR